ncbi:hypothetical protein HUA74_22890 [Myxococcus sp. CA051A]|uniref:Uncharacterized protein n=1 Tax=Myxococcus llanfairpwllgwyngyllgogerychwyrndrobwllllantysiliogogogochensis TaxID=2590453 RepID=A0A540WPF8_9BACT|nr:MULTISPECIES: hypothetical protein [Myxococcus]NTX08889.1 hypothetical protein [Myxococcus sp. CA040A]NTX40807.1 hypothetical protein [Myxococcus sp. CA033]NTX57517.1 hypothetical protein [Myxococcus sp. CA039A]NTX63504.1 hypothetical protein [Myxococcus sp. CA051A]TQF10314.1 hypothetical protein FJV41_40115 [Myxococcus llanfairpwllgwyngyllgogerychwyrndrobwllllantysiliogogogochensis]
MPTLQRDGGFVVAVQWTVPLMATRARRSRRGGEVRPLWRGPREVSTPPEAGGAPPLLCPFWFNLGPQVAANDSEPPASTKARRSKKPTPS